MNIAYLVITIPVIVLLIFAFLSFAKASSPRFQIIYVAVASLCIGIIVSFILVNFESKSAVIWPMLLMLHVISKVRDLRQMLS